MDSTQLIFLGAPGSGKGTQASRLAKDGGYAHVSTGDLLRKEIAKGSELGQKVQGILSDGQLVDDQTVLKLLQANCDLKKSAYIFDGFPRNIEQVKMLDKVLIKEHPSKAIYFEIELDQLLGRLVNRRSCKSCGKIYNLLSNPPRTQDLCDSCPDAGKLEQRADDQEEVVRKRMKVFGDTIAPILEYYDSQSRIMRINAGKREEEVYSQLRKVVESS